jgi:hypothetical protein
MVQTLVRIRLGLLVGLLVVLAASALTAVSASTADAEEPSVDTRLFVRHAAASDCTVLPNYPGEGVIGNNAGAWTIPAGKSVIWRYNVDETWSLVSDPSRPHVQFPWWGFTRRDCIGESIEQQKYPAGQPAPQRIREGRSQHPSGWHSVQFDMPTAPVIETKRATSNGTLRDPVDFVVGNVFEDWTVHVTSETRSNGHWVLVYVPNAQRWGYIERTHLN